MSSLKETQEKFLKSIYNGSEPPELKQSGISQAGRINIYRNNVNVTLFNTLKNIYPIVCKIVDERFFKYAVSEYVKRYPPISGNLDDYGDKFADFLKVFDPVKEMLYLPDVARMEWIGHLVYMAADEHPVEGKNTTHFHNSAYLIKSKYPIDRIRELAINDDGCTTIDLSDRGCYMMIYRPEFKIIYKVLTEEEFFKFSCTSKPDRMFL